MKEAVHQLAMRAAHDNLGAEFMVESMVAIATIIALLPEPRRTDATINVRELFRAVMDTVHKLPEEIAEC